MEGTTGLEWKVGHKIDQQGLHPLKEKKVRAVQDAPSPKSVTELKSYPVFLTYYRKFLPNIADVLARYTSCSEKMSTDDGHMIKRKHFVLRKTS